jgi:hypothetical protein
LHQKVEHERGDSEEEDDPVDHESERRAGSGVNGWKI